MPAASAPVRITDLTSAPGGYSALVTQLQGAITDGHVSYFAAADAQHGTELWRSDGTPGGTGRLTDICPGECSSSPVPVGIVGGNVLFVATDGDRGYELWRTGGRPNEEERLAGVCPSPCGLSPSGLRFWKGAAWFLVQPIAYDAAGRGSYEAPPVLWTTDGTRSGTRRIARFCADLGVCGFKTQGGYATLLGPDAAGTALLFDLELAYQPALLRSDGTRSGTATLAAPFGRYFAVSAAGGAPLYFIDGTNLWRSDGTSTGTSKVRDLKGLVTLDYEDAVYFNASAVLDGVLYAVLGGGEWLRSDGTAAGTVVLARDVGYSRFASLITRLGDRVVAVTSGVWSTRGTPASTQRVSSLPDDAVSFAQVGDQLFFVVNTYANPQPVWITDGTAGGTRRLDLGPGGELDSLGITTFGAGALVTRGGSELWRVSARSSAKVRDLEPTNGPSGPYGQTVFGDRLLFFARDGGQNRLFTSDGTGEGTRPLGAVAEAIVPKCFLCYPYDSAPPEHQFARAGDLTFFDTRAYRVWATDGTDPGTRLLSSGIRASAVGALGGTLLFAGTTPSFTCGNAGYFPGETEPWVSDGSAAGTHEILDLNPRTYSLSSQCDDLPDSSAPGAGVRLGGAVVFAATDESHGRELFASDGTLAGTRLVADIRPGEGQDPNDETRPLDSEPRDLVRLGRRVLFSADDGVTGRELWSSDGAGDTRLVADLIPGPTGSAPHDLVVFGGAVYFFATRGAGDGLWRTDGTAAGTRLVSDLRLAGGATRARSLVVAGRRLFFVGFNEATGSELWESDGDRASTHLVVDLRPGPRGAQPQRLAAVDDLVVFAADDGRTGLEPWRSDGTAAGTVALGNLARGRSASNPGPFSRLGDQLLFGADDGTHGRELWSVPMTEVLEGAAPPDR